MLYSSVLTLEMLQKAAVALVNVQTQIGQMLDSITCTTLPPKVHQWYNDTIVRFPTVRDAYLYASMKFEQDAYLYASMIFKQDVYLYASMIFEQNAYLYASMIFKQDAYLYASMIFEQDTYFCAYIYLNKNSMIEEERDRRGPVKKLVPTLTVDIV
jgi:hypothetical protein